MAPETKAKKRKSAELSVPNSKKPKKSEEQSEAVAARKRSKKADKTAPVTQESSAATSIKLRSSRKRAADFFDGKEQEARVKPATAPVSTKFKKAKKTQEPDETVAPAKSSSLRKLHKPVEDASAPAKSAKERTKRSKKQPIPEEPPQDEPEAGVAVAPEVGDVEDEDVEDEDVEDEVDDQTAALLKGFESSSDEEDAAEGEEGEGFPIDEVPTLPNEKSLRKTLDAASKDDSDGSGVVYVGRIPHGFYEHQMHAYFSQFGKISRLRLSRNAKTGRSKHYAFIEFAHSPVARIVTDTMDKHLMFGHILQVKLLKSEQVHPELFKGAGRRFKKLPRNKIEGRRLRLGMEREKWAGRIGKEEKRRKEKEDKLKALGYEFEAPKVRRVEDVPMKDAAANGANAIEAADTVDPPKALPEVPHQEQAEDKAVESAKNESDAVVPEKAKAKSTKSKGSSTDAGTATSAKKTKKASGSVKAKKAKTTAA